LLKGLLFSKENILYCLENRKENKFKEKKTRSGGLRSTVRHRETISLRHGFDWTTAQAQGARGNPNAPNRRLKKKMTVKCQNTTPKKPKLVQTGMGWNSGAYREVEKVTGEVTLVL
jgi:hypothetical protein